MDVRLQNNADGTLASVSIDNHLKITGRTVSEQDAESLVGESYNINTGLINLTSANESAVMYLKNTDTKNHIIPGMAFFLGNSTGGSGDWMITIVRNPTAGTIVSGASAVAINANNNYGNSQTLTADVYKGAEGNTLTGGADHILIGATGSGRVFVSLTYLVLEPGSSIGVKITPPTSNTSADVYVAFAPLFRETLAV